MTDMHGFDRSPTDTDELTTSLRARLPGVAVVRMSTPTDCGMLAVIRLTTTPLTDLETFVAANEVYRLGILSYEPTHHIIRFGFETNKAGVQ